MQLTQLTLKAWRVNSGLSLIEVSKKLGKTEKTIQNWESGKSIPDFANLYALAELYHTSIDLIFLGDKHALSEHYNEFKSEEAKDNE